jgi:hypothetical protein
MDRAQLCDTTLYSVSTSFESTLKLLRDSNGSLASVRCGERAPNSPRDNRLRSLPEVTLLPPPLESVSMMSDSRYVEIYTSTQGQHKRTRSSRHADTQRHTSRTTAPAQRLDARWGSYPNSAPSNLKTPSQAGIAAGVGSAWRLQRRSSVPSTACSLSQATAPVTPHRHTMTHTHAPPLSRRSNNDRPPTHRHTAS